MIKHTQTQKIIKLAESRGVFTAKEARENGIHSQSLTRLVREGLIERIARGQYRWTGSDVTEFHALVMASAAVPRSVICLLSALQFHQVGTQMPNEVWIAIHQRTWHPTVEYPPLRVIRFSDESLNTGVEHHLLEGRQVAVFDLNKTIADCFKYRNKIGTDVVLEALIETWRARRLDLAALNRYAEICRVQRIMQPYLETLIQ